MFFSLIFISGCSSSSDSDEEEYEAEIKSEVHHKNEAESIQAEKILKIAKEEQENEMYSPDFDSTYLYWLDDELIVLNGSTKCNIFALNVLYKSGFKTPDENALSRDLFDKTKFVNIFPVIEINDVSQAKKGDIIVWYNHVIVFESVIEIGNELYALAWWAGTSHEDNGENINNNVCYGKYKLNGEYVVRRPVKKK
ncbi:MAG: hypothetical protein M3R36_06910 [Bacteroidota bacterium]|nr:hypothetical protein [Bacteroidota bacterium]